MTKRRMATRMLAAAFALSALAPLAPADAAPGNGRGNATGRPADGSVGNADNKAPRGQAPDDANRGYECDANHGVGRGNPAHTGCDTVPDE